jgi:predicted O-linked N-acetylglucosamine transferase (SPINDLY family)
MSKGRFQKGPPSQSWQSERLSSPQTDLSRAVELHQRGKLEKAERIYRSILKADPRNFDAAHLLGVIFLQSNQFKAAERQIDLAIQINPNVAAAHSNRGIALKDLQRFDEALASFDKAVALQRDNAELFNNRGSVLKELKRLEDALTSIDRAIALKGDYAEAFNNRGNTLRELGRHGEALASYDRAIALKPDYAEAHANRGGMLQELNHFEEALAGYDRSMALDPERPYLAGDRLFLQMTMCMWDRLEESWDDLIRAVRRGSPASKPFPLLIIPSGRSEQRACAEAYVKRNYPASPSPISRGEGYGHGRIRIGYFSADFFNHATAYLMAELIERHDRARFEIVGFSFGPQSRDAMRMRLEKVFDRFIDVRALDDRAVAVRAREMEIDIAVDLKGFTANRRPGIFAQRAAPIQVNYLGYPGTMGAPYIDYLIADQTLVPPEHFASYAEKIVHLPHSYQVNDSTRAIAELTPTRAQAGLPEEGFVFCCFNNNYKITPEAFDIWMRLLNAVEGSVLWLLEDNPMAARNLRREAQARGVAPERLVFAPRVALPEHLARHSLADLFVDTFPCTAHTTASDALWAGLPLLSLLGETFAGRVAASLLNAIGLSELIARSALDYEALALKLAREPAALATIRARLAANRSTHPLFDIARFTRHLEQAYQTMAERARNGLGPEHLVVDP